MIYRDVAATKDIFKKVWELQKRVQVVHLAANASWQAPEFFIKHSAPLVKTLGKITISKQRAEHLALLDKSLPTEIQQMYLKVSVWMVRMESNLANRADLRDILNTRMALLSQGPALAERLVGIFRETVHFHISQGAPIKRSQVRALFQAVELVKAIEATFHRRSGMIGQSLPLMAQLVCHRLQAALMPIKGRLEVCTHAPRSEGECELAV
jgi:WASH complex subunit 7